MPVSAVITNLAQFVGEDKYYEDLIVKADGVTPQDISGWNITFTVHAYGDPTTVFIVKTVGNGITLTNPTQGIATIFVQHADTVNMNPDQYSFVIERTDPGGDIVPTLGLFSLLRK